MQRAGIVLMHSNFIADGSLLKAALVLLCCPGSSQLV